MGTNYYHHRNACPHCGRGEKRHIGKSSGGWHFSLHVYPEEGINTLEDWVRLFDEPNSRITNEYGDPIWPIEMVDEITVRSSQWTEQKMNSNHAEPGLNGLVRHKVDGVHCVGNGPGTWDYIIGDFR